MALPGYIKLNQGTSSSSTITTTGNLTGTTTYIPPGTLNTMGGAGSALGVLDVNHLTQFITNHFVTTTDVQEAHNKNAVEVISMLIEKLDNLHPEDENTLAAIKHLKVSKAYLEKQLLEKINNKIDGKRNPDREEG